MGYLSKSAISLCVLTTIGSAFSNQKVVSSPTDTLMVNSPARIAVNRTWDFNLSATFVYWTAKEQGMDVAIVRDYSDNTGVLSLLKNYPVNSSYHPGFKIGLGMNCGKLDNWVVNAEYTHFNNEQHNAVSRLASQRLVPALLSYDVASDQNFTSSKGSWKNDIELIDVQLSRPFYSGKKLTFSPFVGLRSGWIDQSFRGYYSAYLPPDDNGYDISSHLKQDSWLLGPRLGCNGEWLLGSGFRLIGNAAGALFYQHFNAHLSDYYTTFDIVEIVDAPDTYYREITNTVNPNLDCELGLGYGTYFSHDSWHFDLIASYSFQVFFYQNHLTSLSVDSANVAPDVDVYLDTYTPANLILHGLNVSMRFDF